jgi:hypothetical protein
MDASWNDVKGLVLSSLLDQNLFTRMVLSIVNIVNQKNNTARNNHRPAHFLQFIMKHRHAHILGHTPHAPIIWPGGILIENEWKVSERCIKPSAFQQHVHTHHPIVEFLSVPN